MSQKSIIPILLIFVLAACKTASKKETSLPEVHFSLTDMNLGAPTELFYFEDEYHLFYQCSPDSVNLNSISWGHAKSTDLVHWQLLPLAIQPENNEIPGSGSIVIDWNNSSGFGNETTPMVAIYATTNEQNINPEIQTLAISFSTDKGTSWQKEATPITLENCFIQPNDVRVFWHEETQRWMMGVLTGYEVRFYSSVDLKNWKFESVFGEKVYSKVGDWTHLSFSPLKIDGTQNTKWIMMISGSTDSPNEGSGVQYFYGDFDGYVFKSERTKPKWLDNGSDNYAGVVLSNYIESGKPAYYIGLIDNYRYKHGQSESEVANVYSIPRALTLRDEYSDFYIVSEPVNAIETIAENKQLLKETTFSGELKIKQQLKIPLEINLKFDVNNRLYLNLAEVFGIRISNGQGDELTIGYHSQRRYFFISETKKGENRLDDWNGFQYAPYVIKEPTIDLKIIVDRTSAELFAMDGMITLSRKYFISDSWNKIALISENGDITLQEGDITELKSIWTERR
ncbi:MAG: glycoside hydrolase family 32 protein [Bacteroidota bacterium]|nr:glycoside hydrolase family 32 protein [Bacteroidota bacterium]